MNFCYKTASIWQLVGQIIFILKIVVPIILIVMGTIALGNAIISSDERAMNKALKSLFYKIVIGIGIFFVPVIVKTVFNLVYGISQDMKNDTNNCVNCLLSPYNDCDTSYKGEIFTD